MPDNSNTPNRLDPRACAKVAGKAWAPLQPVFMAASTALLCADDNATSHLTTIYVKYEVPCGDAVIPFAVVWLKRSSELVIGLALPEDYQHTRLLPPVPGYSYPNLHKYLVLRQGDELPADFAMWAELSAKRIQQLPH